MTEGARQRLQLVRWLDGDDSAALADAELDTLEPWIHQQVLAPLAFKRGLAQFRGDYATTALLADIARGRLAEAVAALTGHGVDVALLKGVAYAGDLYDDPGVRPMADIDLLVRPHQRQAANEVMRQLGYRGAAESRFHHATMFQRGDHEVFDIHDSIVSSWRSRINLMSVWQRAQRHPEGYWRLEAIDETLFHFVNIARTALLQPMIHFIDAARLLRRLDDGGIAELCRRAREYRVSRAVDAGLYLTDQIVLGSLGRAAPGWLPAAWLEEIIAGEQIGGLELVRRKLLLADTTRARAGHVVQWLLEQPARWSSRLRLG